MDRRNVVKSVLAASAGVVAAAAGSQAKADTSTAPKVVYHLADMEKVGFALGNIRNHIDGMGGPEAVTIAMVVHGPALGSFRADSGNETVKSQLARLTKEKVQLYACIHTMEGMKLTLADLLPGFAVADKGGVVKLAQLQAQGWLYLRP